jgi:EF hand
MRASRRPSPFPLTLLALVAGAGLAFAQGDRPRPAPDEFKYLLKAVADSYRAPEEVEKDVLDELRKQYGDPKPDREAKIFREIHRLYDTTPDQEAAILREIRLAYVRPSEAQEERVFNEIRKADKHPPGAVPASVQADQAARLFRRLDRDGDGLLNSDELPETLRDERAKWDKNSDGFIDPDEYAAYYQAQLKRVADGVASGDIPLKAKLPAAPGPSPTPTPTPGPAPKPALPAGKLPPLPDWFKQLDTDGDGQIGLYEWKAAGRPLAEFLAMDRNGDGYLEPAEVQAYLAEKAKK